MSGLRSGRNLIPLSISNQISTLSSLLDWYIKHQNIYQIQSTKYWHTLDYEAGLYRKLGDVGVVELVDGAGGDVMSAADKW